MVALEGPTAKVESRSSNVERKTKRRISAAQIKRKSDPPFERNKTAKGRPPPEKDKVKIVSAS